MFIGLYISVVLLFGVFMFVLIRNRYRDVDVVADDGVDEEITTTTVTTTTTVDTPADPMVELPTEPKYVIVGDLNRQKEGNQWYVIDPVDHDKMYVNDQDDLYEDGAGKIWSLV